METPKGIIEEPFNCDGCVKCCIGDTIYLHPECGDKVEDYEVEFINGRFALKWGDDNSCIYLDKQKGCTIHGRQPYTCRNFSCVKLFEGMAPKKLKYYVKRGNIPAEVAQEGFKRSQSAVKKMMYRNTKEEMTLIAPLRPGPGLI